MTEKKILCSYCETKGGYRGNLSKAPDFCPTVSRPDYIKESKNKLEETENQKMAQDVARTWKDYGKLTRIEETVLYAKLRGYQKLGLAFCVGLPKEAELLTNLLINEGFDVVSACCMCGALTSEDVALPEDEKIFPGQRQPMCNPIGQAAVLNGEGCDLNILLGLCVGDDTLFIKHSQAPVTVVAVKDRVLANNPLGALYSSFYRRMDTRPPKQEA